MSMVLGFAVSNPQTGHSPLSVCACHSLFEPSTCAPDVSLLSAPSIPPSKSQKLLVQIIFFLL